MNWQFLPNVITLLRLILLVPLSFYLYKQNYQVSLIIFVIAGASDALDGYLAKHFSWMTQLGAIMDPIADKALLIMTFGILTFNDQIQLALFITVLGRDILLMSGAYYYRYKVGQYEIAPSILSKFNTFIQILLVTMVLVSLSYLTLPKQILSTLELIVFITTISSGIHYYYIWNRKLKNALIEQTTTKSL